MPRAGGNGRPDRCHMPVDPRPRPRRLAVCDHGTWIHGRVASVPSVVRVTCVWGSLDVGRTDRMTERGGGGSETEKTHAETLPLQPCSWDMNTPFFSRIRLAAAALVAAAAVSVAACATATHIETSGGGHQILASVNGPHTIESHETGATIASHSGAVTVERTRARIADGPWTTIPEHAPVRVRMSKHVVSIQAGPVTISRTIR